MNLNTNKLMKRIAVALLLIGFIIFTIGFAMNGFTLHGFEYEGRQWYQMVISN